MPISETGGIESDKKERIALEVIRVLFGCFSKFPSDASANENAPFHTAFLNAFTDKLKKPVAAPYLIGVGLNTTLAATFFENVAHILSDGDKREFTLGNSTQLFIASTQRNVISGIISDLKNNQRTPNCKLEDRELADAAVLATGETEIQAQDFTVDNFVEEENLIEAIELKSVRPNAGELRGEKQKILNAKAALRRKYPDKEVRFYFGFPFDPWSTDPTAYDKTRFIRNIIEGAKTLDPNEVLLADELWNKLSGKTSSMRQILDIINAIATPKFIEQYAFLSDQSNLEKNKDGYIALLEKWGLLREKRIVENIEQIRSACTGNKRGLRQLNNWVFNNKGEYNIARCSTLTEMVPSLLVQVALPDPPPDNDAR